MNDHGGRWRQVWRQGIAPQLGLPGLEALAKALETDDPRVIQGATTRPTCHLGALDWPAEACDPITFTAWQGDGVLTVGDLSLFFGRVCQEADYRAGGQLASMWFLTWWDETPREQARRELLAEVRAEIALRGAALATS